MVLDNLITIKIFISFRAVK